MLKANDKAPGFTLPDQDGKGHSLSDYLGKWLLIYFYPKDFTSGCTKEACSFRDNFESFGSKLQIVGISTDSVKSHKKFSEKHKLPFTLLSDADKKVIRSYGIGGLIFAKRTSFLINPKGFIEKIYEKVNPASHAEEILEDISELAS
ncbi:MAG: peroxiredoxin [Patescibacteria group bacterium]